MIQFCGKDYWDKFECAAFMDVHCSVIERWVHESRTGGMKFPFILAMPGARPLFSPELVKKWRDRRQTIPDEGRT
jgi:hypothetical protein